MITLLSCAVMRTVLIILNDHNLIRIHIYGWAIDMCYEIVKPTPSPSKVCAAELTRASGTFVLLCSTSPVRLADDLFGNCLKKHRARSCKKCPHFLPPMNSGTYYTDS